MFYSFSKIRKLFSSHSVGVCGIKGSGKDMLMSNVAVRSKHYYSNIDYGGRGGSVASPSSYLNIDLTSDKLCNASDAPVCNLSFDYIEGADYFLSDAGVYFNSAYFSTLNKSFTGVPVFMALSRHINNSRVHFNSQNLSRVWDKIREQADIYIRCISCRTFLGLVFQKIIIYDRASSADDNIPPCPLVRGSFFKLNDQVKCSNELRKASYIASYGHILPVTLIYFNKSTYDTRYFRKFFRRIGDKK